MTSKTPLWLAIASTLRADISEARYTPGTKLPTEAALAERFGVNRHTVRHALSALVEDGLVRTRRGAGAFVVGRPADYPIGKRVRFHQNLLAAGRIPKKRVLQIETRPATMPEATRLGLDEGDLITIYYGLSLADGQPIALFSSCFREALLPGIAEALRSNTA